MIPAWHQLVPISGHVEESETAKKLQLYATSIKTSVSTRLIGETKRPLGDLIKEHCAKTTSNQSALAEHSKNTGHELDTGNVTVLCREDKLIPGK